MDPVVKGAVVKGETVGPLLIDSISGQSDLLVTLATAICGGIVALIVQIAIHNHGNDIRRLALRHSYLLLVVFAFEGLSIVLGYLVRGSIVASIPNLVASDFMANASVVMNRVKGLSTIECFSLLQFVFFFLGIGLALAFLLCNRRLIN